MPGRYNTDFGREDELWKNKAVKEGKYMLYMWPNGCGDVNLHTLLTHYLGLCRVDFYIRSYFT